jgi:hypothetical protein
MRFSRFAIGAVSCILMQCCLLNPAAAQTLGAPVITDASIAGCNGAYTLSWTPVSGATYYQLLVEYPGTTSYAPLKSVTTTDALVHSESLPNPTSYEVQACDAGGCGGVSAPAGWRGTLAAPSTQQGYRAVSRRGRAITRVPGRRWGWPPTQSSRCPPTPTASVPGRSTASLLRPSRDPARPNSSSSPWCSSSL